MTTTTLNLAGVKKWHDELLFGGHAQGTGALRTINDEMCCLGVACEISGIGEWKEMGGNLHYVATGAINLTTDYVVLPKAVRDSLGMLLADPELRVPDHLRPKADGQVHVTASALNDDYHFTFEEIAECIRETWPEAFEN